MTRGHDDTARDAAPRPSLRERHKAETRRMLRRAAMDLFIAGGYASTSIDDIARTAGTGRATFYTHFDAKWQVVVEAFEEDLVPESLDMARRLDAEMVAERPELRAWLSDALDFFSRRADVLDLYRQVGSVDAEFGDLTRGQLRRATSQLHSLSALLPDESARVRFRLRYDLLFSQLADFAHEWVAGRWPAHREVALDVLEGLWTDALDTDRRTADLPRRR